MMQKHAQRKMRKPLGQGLSLLLCVVVLLNTLAWPEAAAAQGKRADRTGSYWRHYSKANSELPSNNVQAIAYTEYPSVDTEIPGLWIGTDAGLSYTNGTDWMSFTAANSNLPEDDIRALVIKDESGPGPFGTLWIATGAGLAQLSHRVFFAFPEVGTLLGVVTTDEGLPSNDVLSLALGSGEEVWAGTAGGLARYDGKTWRTYTRATSFIQLGP